MRIQSAGTGLVEGAFFSALGDAEAVEVDEAGLAAGEVPAAGVLAVGLASPPQLAVASASAHTKNKYFFIKSSEQSLSWKSGPDYQAGKPFARVLTKLQGNLRNLGFEERGNSKGEGSEKSKAVFTTEDAEKNDKKATVLSASVICRWVMGNCRLLVRGNSPTVRISPLRPS
jgi:hypothetical protein